MILREQNIKMFVSKLKITTRPNASAGLWLFFLLPVALIISAATNPVISTPTYKLSSIFSIGLISSSLISLREISNGEIPKILNLWRLGAICTTATLFGICLHRGVEFSIYSAIFAVILYQKVHLLILRKLPQCFTLGEAAICAQSYTLLLYFTTITIFESIIQSPSSTMKISTTVIQLGLLGISTIILLSYKFHIKNTKTFYGTVIFTVITVILLPLNFLLRKEPLFWVASLFIEDLLTSRITVFWSGCSVVAIAAVYHQIRGAQKASTAIRKIFHILAVAVFVPGLIYNCALLYLASGVVFGLFFILELLRILHIPPLSQHLQNGLVVFSDEKDVGIIALTPMYLLAGCALPLWIHPGPCDVTNSALFSLLPLLSGLLTIGIGDTAASFIGSNYGRFHWKGSKKTYEGTFAYVIFQLVVIYALNQLGLLKFLALSQYIKTAIAILVTSIVEAKTDQVDNLVLPFIMYIILI